MLGPDSGLVGFHLLAGDHGNVGAARYHPGADTYAFGEDHRGLAGALPQGTAEIPVCEGQDVGQSNDVGGVAVVDDPVGAIGGGLVHTVVHEMAGELTGGLFGGDGRIAGTGMAYDADIFVKVDGVHLGQPALAGDGLEDGQGHGDLDIASHGAGHTLLDEHGEGGNQHGIQHACFALGETVVLVDAVLVWIMSLLN